MGLIISSIILSIITFILIRFIQIMSLDIKNGESIKKAIKRTKIRYCFLGFLWLLIILFGCFTTIDANTVGIFYNPFKGGIQNEVLNEGFKAKSPLDKVYKIKTEIQEFNFENISVQTNDSQYVNTIIQVQIRIDKENAFDYFKKYGNKSLQDIQNIISNTIQKQLEQVSTQYNIMEVLGEKRNDIVNETLKLSKEELQKDGISVERIILVDTDAGDTIENAIANEAVKKKEAEAAQYEKEKAQLNGEAKVIEAQKEKEANDLKQTSLTEQILQEKMLEKWNGQLPTTVLNDNIMSVFDINNTNQ